MSLARARVRPRAGSGGPEAILPDGHAAYGERGAGAGSKWREVTLTGQGSTFKRHSRCQSRPCSRVCVRVSCLVRLSSPLKPPLKDESPIHLHAPYLYKPSVKRLSADKTGQRSLAASFSPPRSKKQKKKTPPPRPMQRKCTQTTRQKEVRLLFLCGPEQVSFYFFARKKPYATAPLFIFPAFRSLKPKNKQVVRVA